MSTSALFIVTSISKINFEKGKRAEYAAHMEDARNEYKLLVRKTKVVRLLSEKNAD